MNGSNVERLKLNISFELCEADIASFNELTLKLCLDIDERDGTTHHPIADGTSTMIEYPSDGSIFLEWGYIVGDFLTFYYTPALVVIGCIGNILSVLVFFNTKLKKLSSSYYLAALGFSDTCFLLGLFVTWLSFFQIHIYTREVYCQLFTFTSGLSSFLSVWYVVAFTFERFIVVLYPLRRQSWCTVRRAKLVIVSLTVLGILHSAPYIFFAGPQFSERSNSTICDVREEYKPQMIIFNYIDTVIVFLVPFTVILVLNSITSFTVWRVANLRRTMTLVRRKPSSFEIRRQLSIQRTCSHPNHRSNVLKHRPAISRMVNSQMKVTKMLLIVSSVFVCLNLPSYLMRVRAFIETEPSNLTVLIQYYCYLFFITNFGINFILYCISGQNFRKAVIEMFNRTRRNQMNQDHFSGGTQTEIFRSSGSLMPLKRTNTTTYRSAVASWNEFSDYPSSAAAHP
ncbi:growth hormone secretagogue receptor type 1-like isoform X2 [Toxorhynchites rutilus septentrionalis]|uniref:growth hormone secretagogue receptor type 1-like isoform X2 n=1 Tax=Toxorhynchites rutilus septentrionalis TaxID=329112 RepID=UPI00247957BD|nr:growth hormone secretagogue receptor type 1-like isoform X2 [Toxorhynchites rutilus septentrionalis]